MRWLPSVLAVLGMALVVLSTTEVVREPPRPSPVFVPERPQMVSPPSAAPKTSSGKVRPRQPTQLRIWGLEAPVIPLTLTGSELNPPDDPQVLGWWGRPAGARKGTTLLTGHTVSSGGGTFDDLEHIPVGTAGSLSGVRYRVTSVEVISKEELADRAEDLFNQEGEHRLVLVTCEGYDHVTRTYSENVVVVLQHQKE